MKRLEEASDNLGISKLILMENAGRCVVQYLKRKFLSLNSKTVVVLAGIGNNGGDGFVIARLLAEEEARISIILLGEPNKLKTEEARINWKSLKEMSKIIQTSTILDKEGVLKTIGELGNVDIIVDSIFGIGIKGNLREPYASAVSLINECNGFKVAVDIPSGLDPMSGKVLSQAVRADATVTFHKAKIGLLSAREYVGELIVSSIGIPLEAEQNNL